MIKKVTSALILTLTACSSLFSTSKELWVSGNGKLYLGESPLSLDIVDREVFKSRYTVEISSMQGDATANDLLLEYFQGEELIFSIEKQKSENRIYRVNVFSDEVDFTKSNTLIAIGQNTKALISKGCSAYVGEELGTYIDCSLHSEIIAFTECEESKSVECKIDRVLLNNYP
jgi:hypothetical protein